MAVQGRSFCGFSGPSSDNRLMDANVWIKRKENKNPEVFSGLN
jgi:hypothetical protein